MSMALALSALGAFALTSGIALAAAQPHEMGDHPQGEVTRAQAAAMAAKRFEQMDVNRDGGHDRADREAMHARMTAEMFDRADTNKDGTISRDEWTAGAARFAGMQREHGGMGMRGRPMMMNHMGMMADADGDRAVSRQEFEARALQHFDRVDANKDGRITADERAQAHAAMRERSERK